MKRPLLALALLLSVSCGAVLSALPTVIAAVTDAMGILGMIEQRAGTVLDRVGADAAMKAQVQAALGKAKAALNAALRASQAADAAGHLDQASADRAFESFKLAYLALLEVVQPLGIVEQGTALGATADASGTVLRVPRPEAFALKVPR